MSPIPIPPELIDEVFGHCSHDSLTKCALANATCLDLARAHLYHTICTSNGLDYAMSCPSRMQLFIHTKHIAFVGKYTHSISFLHDIHRLGRLETLTQDHDRSRGYQRFSNSEEMEEHYGILLQIVSLPTIKRFRLGLFDVHLRDTPQGLPALVSSSKLLRDLSFIGGVMEPHLIPLQQLDTIRVYHTMGAFPVPNHFAALRRLSLFIVSSPHDIPTAPTEMKDWFAFNSRQLTHLALSSGSTFDEEWHFEVSNTTILTGPHEFPSLQSLTLRLQLHQVHGQLMFLSFFFDHISPNGPFSPTIHVVLRKIGSPSGDRNTPWQMIPQYITQRVPQCRLFLYFENPEFDIGGVQNIPGVERMCNLEDVSGGRFFSDEVTDKFLS